MLKEHYKVYEEKMKKSVEAVERDFGAVRAGRANASVLNRIQVDYYGTPTPIQQIAAVASPDPRTLLITPWDASALKGIEKAIQESDLGINPQNDGKSIRLAFPQLTEERRKDLTKQVRKYCEEGKVALRNIRRDAMEDFKKKKKAAEITEQQYTLVRIAITIGAVIAAFQNSSHGINIWSIMFGIVAILFNPIIPVYLHDKGAWMMIDIIAMILFIIQIVRNKE